MRLAIDHVTTYHFAAPIRQGLQRLRLTPVTARAQTVIAWDIECDGGSAEVGYDDENVNRVTLVGIAPGTRTLTIRAHGLVETSDEAGVFGRHQGYLPLWHFQRETALTKAGAGIAALTEGLDEGGHDRLATLHALTARVGEAVKYEQGHTDVATTAEAVLAAGHGVCQDQAHVFIAAARVLGIPARYVSGYLLLDGKEAQEAGHGWAEGFVEGLGWVGFDVANAVCPDDRYVRVASGRDYDEAAPIKGVTQAPPADDGDGAPVPERLSIALTVRALDLA
jgi:transglutaminase-like putative cysteine protease